MFSQPRRRASERTYQDFCVVGAVEMAGCDTIRRQYRYASWVVERGGMPATAQFGGACTGHRRIATLVNAGCFVVTFQDLQTAL